MKSPAEILAELNAANDEPERLDPAPEQSPSRDKALMSPVPVKTKTEVLNDNFATRNGGKGFSVEVEGDYCGRAPDAPGKTRLRPFSGLVFNLPNLDAALSTITKKLLKRKLEGHPVYGLDFVTTHKCRIVGTRPLSPETPASRHLDFMPREGLEAHISLVQAPIIASDYADIKDLRAAVVDYTLNPKGFEEREAKKQKAREEERELLAMNPELGAPAPEAPVAVPAAPAKVSDFE